MKRTFLALALAAFVFDPGAVQAQARSPLDLSTYGGTNAAGREARGFCWDKAKLARTSSPKDEAQAKEIRACVDRVLAGNVPAKDAPQATSARGRCIQQLPDSIYNKETRRYSNTNVALVIEKCGAPPQ